MCIPKNASAAIVVSRDWANLAGVRIFLRRFQAPSEEIGGSDHSHLILARVLDSVDDRGLWIELFTNQQQKDPKIKKLSLMIPWVYIIAIALAEEWTPTMKKELGKIGYIGSPFS